MSTVTLSNVSHSNSLAGTMLAYAVRFWFLVAVGGQFIFAFTIASFYGRAAAIGDPFSLNSVMTHGYIAGAPAGNIVVVVHLVMAASITLAGALQLTPQIRDRAPSIHRWLGRYYIGAALTVSIAGLYMVWFRGTVGDLSQHIGVSLNAVLIVAFAIMTLRYAIVGDFKTHRRWALRTFLVVGGVWFFRVGLMFSMLVFHGPFGFDPHSFTGPFLTFLIFAQFLVPLAVLELYLKARDRSDMLGLIAVSIGLFVLTVAMGAGIMVATIGMWLPKIETAYSRRESLHETLEAAIPSQGINETIRRYHALRAAAPAGYDFGAGELNTLGYDLLRAGRFNDAIVIFELNVHAYPKVGNTYDSLAEAYLDAGNDAQAIENYHHALILDPKNDNAAEKLLTLRSPSVK